MASVSETCGYTVIRDGEEQPCDYPATGWRWYQDVEHEDMLDAACEVHENKGGRRIHDAEAKLARVEALFSGGPDGPCRTTWRYDFAAHCEGYDGREECVEVPVAELRAALADAPAEAHEHTHTPRTFRDTKGSHLKCVECGTRLDQDAPAEVTR
jgi:hypothetical protein